MALTLPGWLVEAISYLGYDFPQTNEDTLHAWADHLRSLDGTMDSAHSDLVSAVNHLKSNNEGGALDSFVSFTTGSDSEAEALTRFSGACEVASAGCDICGYAVVVLKGVTIAQLVIMAASLAGGPLSFLVRKGVEFAINLAISEALEKLLAE